MGLTHLLGSVPSVYLKWSRPCCPYCWFPSLCLPGRAGWYAGFLAVCHIWSEFRAVILGWQEASPRRLTKGNPNHTHTENISLLHYMSSAHTHTHTHTHTLFIPLPLSNTISHTAHLSLSLSNIIMENIIISLHYMSKWQWKFSVKEAQYNSITNIFL